MSPPPLWNPRARFRAWSREDQAKAQIAAIAALAIGLIVVMVVVTLVIILRLVR